ncbi:hypothetical protein D3C73_1546530 [compost metagenome]
MMIAIVRLLFALRLLAYTLGEKPISSAIARIRALVAGLMSTLSRNARETVDFDKPSFLARSTIVN